MNQAAIDRYGYSREEFLAMTIRDIRPASEIPALEQVLDQYASQQQFKVPGIVTHQKKNGELIQVDIHNNDILYKGRKARAVIANDITERLKYVQAVEKQNEKLREISWMQSHVIRAPLARIMGLLPMFKDAGLAEKDKQEILGYLIASADELDGVIKNITDVTSIVPVK